MDAEQSTVAILGGQPSQAVEHICQTIKSLNNFFDGLLLTVIRALCRVPEEVQIAEQREDRKWSGQRAQSARAS